MKRSKTCIVCGRDSISKLFVGSLCLDCFIDKYGLVDHKSLELEINMCKRCGSLKYKGKWVSDKSIEDVIYELLQSQLKPSNDAVKELSIESIRISRLQGLDLMAIVSLNAVLLTDRGYKAVRKSLEIPVKVKYALCPECIRLASKSWSAVLQIRSSGKTLTHLQLDNLRRFLSKIPYGLRKSIVEIEDVKGGIDIKISDQQSARIIASKMKREFLAKITETHKVIGREKSGKPKTRMTISIRLPSVEVGDTIRLSDGSIGTIKDLGNGRIIIDTGSKSKLTISQKDLWERKTGPDIIERIPASELEEALVFSVTPKHVSFMLLSSGYEIVEYTKDKIKILGGEISEGKTVRVYRDREKGIIYVLDTIKE